MTTEVLKSLSATSVQNFEQCPSMWYWTNQRRTPSEGGHAALLGTTVHEALEIFIRDKHHLLVREAQAQVLAKIYSTCYNNNFPTDLLFEDGRRMLMLWLERCDPMYWATRTVLSTEVKESFELRLGPDSDILIPFNFIWDRCDRVDMVDGHGYEIDVVDYKSWRMPIGPDAIRGKTQTGAYALAAHLKYPNAQRIWVTMDQLRHDPVSVVYTAEEADAMLAKLTQIGNKILARLMVGEDAFEEEVGSGCRYCVKKMTCSAIQKVEQVKPLLAAGSTEDIARAAFRLKHSIKAQEDALAELEHWIRTDAAAKDATFLHTPSYAINLKMSSKRSVHDHAAMAKIVGPSIMAREGTLTMAVIDKLMKGNDLNDVQKSQLKGLIRRNWSPTPSVEITPRVS